jgi:hypothetical protein
MYQYMLAALLAASLVQLPGCASKPVSTAASEPTSTAMKPVGDRPVSTDAASPEAVYGIRVDGLHLSAHGYILDLRYRVLDADKAAVLLDAKQKVYLLDAAHSAKLGVPESPIIGGMRQTSRNHVIYTDRDYFILFVNPGRAVRVGDTLKLAVGDTKIAELTVQ